MAKKWLTRLLLAALAGALVPLLPSLLTAPTGTADLSSRLGLAGGVGAGTYAVLYLAGLLTSLTPCVYPLIAITLGVFGAKRSEGRGRSAALAGTYVLGIATTYSGLGLFAALSGRAFGGALASPWVAAAMAVFLLALAASMFGAFEIDLPQGLKQRLSSVRGVGFLPAFAMGLVAGVIAAPCTGPVLAGVLVYVATTRSAGLGFRMLFTYALGMGTLFFALAASSVRLPRSGAWMETVKSVLGVALVAVGAGLLLPFLPRPGMLPLASPEVGAIAGALAFAAVACGALTLSFHGQARERLQKMAALLALVLAVGLRAGWMGAPHLDSHPIAWLHDEPAALALAQRTGKPVLVDFFAEWCAACKELDVHTFSDPVVQREVREKFVPLKIDATDETEEVEKLTVKYGVPGLPTVLIFGCEKGTPAPIVPPPAAPASAPALEGVTCAVPDQGAGRLVGFEPPAKLLERMRQVQCAGERC